MLAASRRNVIVSRRFDDDGAGFDNGGPRTDVALCMLEDAAASKDAAKLAFEAGRQEDALDGYHFAIDVSRAAARRAMAAHADEGGALSQETFFAALATLRSEL